MAQVLDATVASASAAQPTPSTNQATQNAGSGSLARDQHSLHRWVLPATIYEASAVGA
jgi:hypothetical protein